jgi:peptidoglycan/xylan/chitin deacetylase (PgdA/CDA1 family)
VKITLTFDNGPRPEATPGVLEVLERHGIGSTFFLVGSRLDAAGIEIAREAWARGHRLGNHTWTHSRPLGTIETHGEARDEILRTQDRIDEIAEGARLFRPMGGGGGGVLDRQLFNREAIDTLREGLFTVVLWNVVPRDWEQPREWVEKALDQCAGREHSLVVIHDAPNGAMEHLDEFIDRATVLGAEFVQDYPVSCTPMVRGEGAEALEEFSG